MLDDYNIEWEKMERANGSRMWTADYEQYRFRIIDWKIPIPCAVEWSIERHEELGEVKYTVAGSYTDTVENGAVEIIKWLQKTNEIAAWAEKRRRQNANV